MAYFKNISTLDELRKQYQDLLKKHHPDNGGNVSDMQEINAEYDRLRPFCRKLQNKNVGCCTCIL